MVNNTTSLPPGWSQEERAWDTIQTSPSDLAAGAGVRVCVFRVDGESSGSQTLCRILRPNT